MPWKQRKKRNEYWRNDTEGNSRTRKKPSLSATASLTNFTHTGLGSNPGFLDDRTVTKRLRLGTDCNLLLESGSLIMKLLVHQVGGF